MRRTVYLICSLFLSVFVSTTLFAQVTTSSMSGRVTEKDGSAVAGATVVATHTPSGTTYYTTTDENGSYRIPNMRVGGPYSVEVTLLGYGTVKSGGGTLKLGENFVHNITMTEESLSLDELVVTAQGNNPILNSDKTGASTNFSSAQLRQLPTVNRSLTDFTQLTPQANGTSFGGRDNRMNTITVDGAAFNNNFGLSTTQILPGGEAQPIALDAIDEITVNLTPFDIKQSQFTGASISAVTKSGTNTFTGSFYTYQRPKSFTGDKVGENTVSGAHDTKSQTYGLTFGGPIVKDKLFFFISGEYEKATSPSGAYEPSTDGVGNAATKVARTTVEDLKTMHDYLLNTYGYEAGSYQNFSNFSSENHKILARIDWNIHKNHKLTIRYNEVISNNDEMTNATSGPSKRGSGRNGVNSVVFSNSWYGFENTVRSITGELNSTFGKVSNNLLVSYTMIDDKRTSPSDIFPMVDIWKGGDNYMSFGYELFSYNNDVKNNTLSIKDNVNFDLGINHFTVGASFDRLYFKNAYMREGTSYYKYDYDNTADPATGIIYADGMEAFMAGATPTEFGFTYGYGDDATPGAELAFGLAALYAQDEVQATDNLKLTFGLRAELPLYLNDLETNSAIDAYGFNKWNHSFHDNYAVGESAAKNYNFRSGKWPKSRVQLSPRIGFNWDVKGDRSIQLRGGTGLFTGFLPFVWFTNKPASTGMTQSPETLITDSETLQKIKFTPNFKDLIANNPTLFPQTPGKLPSSGLSLCEVDEDFRMPQVWKTSLAADFKLPWNMIFTVEEIYSKDINAVVQRNVNMEFPAGYYSGEDQRPYWTTTKLNSDVSSAMLLTNTSKGFQNSLTVQLTKNMTRGLTGSLAYTWTIAKDVTSNPGSTASSAWSSNTVISYLNDPELSYSNFAIPHRIVGNITYRFEWLKNFATTLSLTYNGGAQGRMSWTYSNDMNQDGYSSDLLYIPKTKNGITFVDATYSWTDGSGTTQSVLITADQQADAFWQLVESNSYLKKHKGKYASRFGYVAPWRNQWDIKILQDIFSNFGTNRRFTLQASLDIINVGNLLNKNWGTYKIMNSQSYNNLSPLTFVGVENNTPTFKLNSSASSTDYQSIVDNFINNNTWQKDATTDSTWGMLFGIRLLF